MEIRSLTALVQRDGDAWSALCPEFDVASQGRNVEEAKANLREAVELFLVTAPPDEVAQRLKSEIYLSSLEVHFG
jgi:predicted RNase H-like HicB family nuclease